MQWRNKTILIVEDDNSNRVYFEKVIGSTGAKVITTNNGIDAFTECIKNPDISVVVLDIMLPKLNGFETCRLIKKYRPDIFIVVETACAFEYEKNICYKYGCNDYLIKPILPETIKEAISNCFYKKEIATL